MAALPRTRPEPATLERCKIVSHRGEHRGTALAENTMEAFRLAADAGVWGIEADIRWTADLVPMVIHDPDTMRVFGEPVTLADVGFDELRSAVPRVPTLAELVAAFGGKTHLMLELKDETFPDIARQQQILDQQLAGLAAGTDYHILALDPLLFETFDIQPRRCCLPVAWANTRVMSQVALAAGYGGLTGHYLLLNKAIQSRHQSSGQKIGTGFVRSRNGLYRELNRGVDWIFSNDAVHLQSIIGD